MADKFGKSNNVLIKSFRENKKNKNAQQGKNSLLRLCKSEAPKLTLKVWNGDPEQNSRGILGESS